MLQWAIQAGLRGRAFIPNSGALTFHADPRRNKKYPVAAHGVFIGGALADQRLPPMRRS